MAIFTGTDGDDTITPATISAGVVSDPPYATLAGNDKIFALRGDDVVDAGDGNDTIDGGAGDDQLEGAFGDDVAFGQEGDDRFAWDPGDGDDTFDGGSGTDTLEFTGSDDAELMTITTLENGGFLFFRDVADITINTSNVERVEVIALGGDDVIDGSGQKDPAVSLVVDAGDGNDTIDGGAGDDQLEGAFGDDVAFGQEGDDRFAWDPGDGDDTFDGGSGTDTLEFTGSDDAELMTITTLENGGFLFFRDVADITINTSNVERVEVIALGGDDTVDGSAQTRSSVALEIQGGAGNDSLTGGAGPDAFVFGAESSNGVTETDTISGYSKAYGDVIDLSAAGGFIYSDIVSGNLQLTLGGGDEDVVVIQGVYDIHDVTIIA